MSKEREAVAKILETLLAQTHDLNQRLVEAVTHIKRIERDCLIECTWEKKK